ncbi:MAG: hypothetical protein KAH84_01920 [Thiomargarita sp.]|nr:hypothetical protein [Thiomargarita sp.]
MKFSKLSLATCIILGTTSSLTIADSKDSGFSLFSDSILYSQLRPRFEYADGGSNSSAKAFTVRTVIGGKFNNIVGVKKLTAVIEANNVSHFGILDDYAPEQTGYNVIMDPSQTRMTQAHFDYKTGNTNIIIGRKMLGLDNQRFIGHVGWRQMPQTYDLLAVIDKSIKNLTLAGAYVKRVNKITENGKLDTNSVLLNGSYNVLPTLKVTAYSYMLSSIHDTFGLRATGKVNIANGMKISYEAEYATQNKATFEEESMNDVQPDHEANYYKLGTRLTHPNFVFGIDYEVLGEKEGSEGGAFYTPLATLHAMNGFADKFLKTPDDGLVDTSIVLGYINKEFGRIIAIYHDFESDNGGKDYGSEFDIVYVRKLNKNLNLFLKSAFYKEGDDFGVDTTKYWAMLDYKFNF